MRTVLVTGGTGGIGRAVALRIGASDDRVLFTGRDRGRGLEVLARLPDAEFLPADLALLADTARLAGEVAARTDVLDAVICCAGCLSAVPVPTAEGLERTLVLNYLSRFLLIDRLRPLLRRSDAPRIVLVAAAGRYPDTLDLDDLHLSNSTRRGLWVSGRTQFANDVLALELAERLAPDGINTYCVDPGLTRTDVFRRATGFPAPVRAIATLAQRVAGRDPARTAETPARLAAATERPSGFYGAGLRVIEAPAITPERRRAVWAATAAITG
ncbi:SDR family NAD(P)-dependent oxidoreductase [Dactylosporangium sp. NPDC051541]|uniref:SDR family NAD(P)-dependent oxidoreductase n=1 Tax=Dactylosporangium sp. NPDC051541 TaxID=3363977 RepID=UPI0037B28BE6